MDKISELEELIHGIKVKGGEFAKAKANRVYLEAYKSSLQAILGSRIDGSQAAKDSFARSSVEYIEHLGALKAAVYLEERLKYELESITARFEAWRTIQATKRQELISLGNVT